MKKNRFRMTTLAMAAALAFAACSDKEDGTTTELPDRLIEKTTWVHYIDKGDYTIGSVSYSDYEWTEGRLVRWTSSGTSYEYIYKYNGDKLHEILTYRGALLLYRNTVAYTGDYITDVEVSLHEDGPVRVVWHFTRNDQGEIVKAEGTSEGSFGDWQLTYLLEWKDGNLVQYSRFKGDGEPLGSTTLTYDNMRRWNSIVGESRLYISSGFVIGAMPTKNNVLTDGDTKYRYTYEGGSVSSYTQGTEYTNYIKYVDGSDPAPEVHVVKAEYFGNQCTVKGNGSYVAGKTVKLLAEPKEGYHFVQWTGEGGFSSTDNPLVFTCTADVAYRAQFEAD